MSASLPRLTERAEETLEKLWTGAVEEGILPLATLRPGQEGRIAYVQTDEARRLQKLMAMGVLPGKTIRLLLSFPSYVFQVGHSQFAVDREIARTIHVQVDR